MSITVALTIVSTVEHAAGITTELLGLAALAGILGAVVSLAYRSFAHQLIPRWLAVVAGVSGVAVYLGTTPALETIVREGIQPSEAEIALFNVGGLLAGAGGAVLGRAVGDRFGTDVLLWSPTQDVDEDVSRLAQTIGRVTTVSLPRRIDDASGYDPAPKRTKESLAGTKLVFPRGLTVDEVETRITERLQSDYGVDTVDVAFDAAGDVTYLAVGTRAAGIGSTLPPATNAVALRADPGFAASTGDIVQVWDPEDGQRVLTGEVRGIADDVVTVAIDASDTPKVDPSRQYRLVTLPVEDRPDREFASLLRTAAETFSTVAVEAGSPLHGLSVGALDLTVTALRPDDGEPVPFPDGTYRLAPGDLLFVIARPGELRRLETASEPLDPAVVSDQHAVPTDRVTPSEESQTADSTTMARDGSTNEGGLPPDQQTGSDDPTDQQTGPDDPTDEIVRENAGADSFDEIKAQLDSADSPIDQATDHRESATDQETDHADDVDSAATSFDELKSAFDAGETDWDEPQTEREQDEPADAVDPSVAQPADERGQREPPEDDDSDDLVSLEDAEITFDESADSDTDRSASETDDRWRETPPSDDLGNLTVDDEAGEIENLAVDDEADDLDGLDTTDERFEETTQESADGHNARDDNERDADGDDGDDTEDEDESSDGAKSFAELKAEFESGEADWEEDVSDSPGGDMRLDE